MENTQPVLLIEKINHEGIPFEVWTINRMIKLNALNSAVLESLQQQTQRLAQELEKNLNSTRALILRGAGEKAFVAGADIAEMQIFGRPEAEAFSKLGQEAFGRLELLPIPTIASIRGFALGGGLEVAMCCDILVADSNSEFGQPEAYLGLIPGFGATARFLDRVGISKGLELLFSGRRIKANEALRLGLIQDICDDGKSPYERALELALECTRKSGPVANKQIKFIAQQMRAERFSRLLALESRLFGEIFETKDKVEGIAAFLEKRKAQFSGT